MAYKDSFRTVGRLSSYGRRRLVALLAVVAVVAAVAVAVLAGGGHKQAHVPEASSGKPRQRVSFLSRIVPPAEVPERPSRTSSPLAASRAGQLLAAADHSDAAAIRWANSLAAGAEPPA